MTKFSSLLAILSVTFCFSASTASAVTVTYGGTDYDVTTISGTFDQNSTQLMNQLWYGNISLADTFASLIDTLLGVGYGPLFVYTSSYNGSNFQFSAIQNLSTQIPNPGHHATGGYAPPQGFAVATLVSSVPLPAGLPLLLTGLAGLTGLRMRKKRSSQV